VSPARTFTGYQRALFAVHALWSLIWVLLIGSPYRVGV
jgi:hypothetical protein